MPLFGMKVTDAGELRLRARPPQILMTDLADTNGWEPGRPVRLYDRKGSEVLASGVLDPENEVVRLYADREVAALDLAFFRARVRTALAWRKTLGLADPAGRAAYRLINAEGDGLGGLSVDVYGCFAVVTALSRGLVGVARLCGQAVLDVFASEGLPMKGAVIKVRLKAAGSGAAAERVKDDVLGERPADALVVEEEGVPFEVHLLGGINTGLFLDMREHRRGLARFVRGKRVLNTFCYSGALSVAAARSGATAVASVDFAAGVIEWTKTNLRLSGFDPADARFRYEVSDVFRFLDAEFRAGGRWDVIILDPPTVSGAGAKSWAQKRDYPELVAAACAILPDHGGHLWVSSNTHKGPSVGKHIDAGLALANRRADVVESGSLPPDFPTPTNWPLGRYLEVVQLRVAGA